MKMVYIWSTTSTPCTNYLSNNIPYDFNTSPCNSTIISIIFLTTSIQFPWAKLLGCGLPSAQQHHTQEIAVVTIIFTHQGVEYMVMNNEIVNMLVYLKWSNWITIFILENQCIRRKKQLDVEIKWGIHQ